MTGNLRRKPVLVVDDDPHILLSVKVVLEYAGYHVTTALSGKDCIEELKRGFSGILLLDIMMPEMDGWDTIRAIQREKLGDHLLIVMLTAMIYPDKKMIGLEDYVFDYITKPFDSEDLIKRVNTYSEYGTE